MSEMVVLVNEQDQEIGVAEKIAAHQQAQLHRAFSAFLVAKRADDQWVTLLQKRSEEKYHCPGLWTNSCCSHPRPQEALLAAAERRCKEELNLETQFKALGNFIYKAHFANGLCEYEYDHVLLSMLPEPVVVAPNQEEVAEVKWATFDEIFEEVLNDPKRYTPWFLKAAQIVFTYLHEFN